MEDRIKDRVEKDPFEDDIAAEFESAQNTKKCKTCGADIDSDAQFCPYCGAAIGESVMIREEEPKAPKGPIAPRPLKKGEKVQSAAPTQEYKYGDGYSLSSLPLYTLMYSWVFPVIALIVSLIFNAKTKNPKDRRLFKVCIIASVVFLIVHIVLIVMAILGQFTPQVE